MSLMKRASQIRFQQLARNDGNSGEILCSSEMPRIVMFEHFLNLLSETFSSEVKVVEVLKRGTMLSDFQALLYR